MKNILKVLRFKDNATRLYTLPEGMAVKTGTLVTVEFPDQFNTCVGVAVSNSYEVDGDTARMVMEFHKMTPAAWDSMKRVISAYTENPVDWPVDDEDDPEADGEDAEEADDEMADPDEEA